MISKYFYVQSNAFLYFDFDCSFSPSPLLLTTAAIFLFDLVSTEPVTFMKILSEIEDQLLPTTALPFKSNVNEKGDA